VGLFDEYPALKVRLITISKLGKPAGYLKKNTRFKEAFELSKGQSFGTALPSLGGPMAGAGPASNGLNGNGHAFADLRDRAGESRGTTPPWDSPTPRERQESAVERAVIEARRELRLGRLESNQEQLLQSQAQMEERLLQSQAQMQEQLTAMAAMTTAMAAMTADGYDGAAG
jgi:hypothetical protein